MGFGQATPQPCLGPLQREQEGQKDLQAPLLEFCYQTSHLPPAGPRGRLLPVNKVTVLARTLQAESPSQLRHEQSVLSSSNRPQVERQEGEGRHGVP